MRISRRQKHIKQLLRITLGLSRKLRQLAHPATVLPYKRTDIKRRTTISTRDSSDRMYVDVTLPAWSCSTISSASDADMM
jgi:hypothetical protein